MKRIVLTLLTAGCYFFLFSQNFTVADVLSAPYCTDLISSKNGRHIAWVSNEKGIRKIFTATSPEFVPKELYSTGADDGQVLSNLQFDHAGRLLYFVQGSTPNRAGEVANPASLVKYPKQILYSVDRISGVLDDLGSHGSFIIAPDDSYLILAKGNTLSRMQVSTEVVEAFLTMRGNVGQVSFSPSGNSIAFTSNRGDHSFIGIYTFGKDRIRWLAPSVDRDQYPQWSPDGRQIAFLRVPGALKGELRDITSGNPFSILVYDLDKDQSSTIWSSPGDDGGFAQYYHSEPLRWSKSGNILFYSEHEGWMKMYIIPPDGSAVKNILPGPCEIEHSHLNETGTHLVFSSNCEDIDRRNLFITDLISGQTTRLTESSAIETDPVLLNGDTVAYRHSTYNTPAAIATLKKVVYPQDLSMSFPKAHLVQPIQAIFEAEDGTTIHGQLFVKDRIKKKPAILFMHGGPIRQMLLGFHYSGYYANAYAMNQYLADQGYVVLSVNFRAGIGYGRDFRRASDQGPRGASEYQDVVAGARYLQNLDYVDPDNIGLWGGSYGGLLTAQGLAKNSDLFKAGVDFHGVHDWAWRAEDFSEGGFWGIGPDLMDMAYASSPVAEVKKWTSPVLFIHGDDDRNVMFGQTVDLVQRLRQQGTPHEILVLPDEVHGFYRWSSWLKAFKASADFFKKYLPTAKPTTGG